MVALAFYFIGIVAALAVIGVVGGVIIGVLYAVVRIVLLSIGKMIFALFWTVELLEAVIIFITRSLSRRRIPRPVRSDPTSNS